MPNAYNRNPFGVPFGILIQVDTGFKQKKSGQKLDNTITLMISNIHQFNKQKMFS